MIGELRFVSLVGCMSHVATSAQDMPDWWFDKQAGGGWLGAYGSHCSTWCAAASARSRSLRRGLANVSGGSDLAEDTFACASGWLAAPKAWSRKWRDRWAAAVDHARGRQHGYAVGRWHLGLDRDKAGTRGCRCPRIQNARSATDHRRSASQTARWKNLVAVELPAYTALCTAFRNLIEGYAAVARCRYRHSRTGSHAWKCSTRSAFDSEAVRSLGCEF